MPQTKDNIAQQLYNLLTAKGFNVKSLNNTGDQDAAIQDSDIFSFDFVHKGTNYGSVVIILKPDLSIELLVTDAIGKHMDNDLGARDAWFAFLQELRNFARRKSPDFKISDASQLPYRLKAAESANLAEGRYWGSKHISRTTGPQKTKLRIRHNRDINEGDARFRHIQELFIETADEQRFKLPFTSLVGGRAMARHCAEGGNPWDPIGQNITKMVKECAVMGNFLRRVSAGNWANTPQIELVEAARRHYQEQRKRLKSLAGRRGYQNHVSNFDSTNDMVVAESTVQAIKELFCQAPNQEMVSEVAPILGTMAEADQFESWADSLLEGTWSLPQDKEAEDTLIQIMSQPLKLGANAQNATGKLYDLLGDDVLFDMLSDAAESDPEADARPIVLQWMQHQGADHESVARVAQKLTNTQQIDTKGGAPKIKSVVREPDASPDPVDVQKELSGVTQRQVPPNTVGFKP
jgi:hypothetical protein